MKQSNDMRVEQDILQQIDMLGNELLDQIVRLVQIDSTEQEAASDAPFGPGVREALDHTLALADSLGFETVDVDHYLGYASYRAPTCTEEGYICAMGHLDVVPAGIGWKQPPFSGWRQDGVIYSRGVLDNKGPILSCLYALYALKQLKLPLKREVRIIFGCDEETGFEDLKHYLRCEQPPVMGFTPDCKYPVVYAERGRAIVEIVTDGQEHLFELMNQYILNAKNNGERLGIAFQDDEFGMLEVRNYALKQTADGPAVRFSISYPAGCTAEELMERLRHTLPQDQVRLISNFDPVRFDKECRLVDTLRYTYEQVTGKDGSPVTTTGGTYAKLMPNIVPFGPSFPGQKGIGHQPNEWMAESDILTNAKIYALSLYYLAL